MFLLSRTMRLFALTLCVCALLRSASAAQPNSARPIELDVDATEAPRRLFRARLAIPVQPGPLTLVYPKWIPGEHGPTGPIGNLAGLKIEANGKLLQWQRDDVDLYAFHVIVPDGADELKVALECLEPAKSSSGSGNDGPTENLALVLWYKLILYPLGQPVHDIPVHARLTVPAGWKVGTALPMESDSGATIRFQRVSLEKLADSPALCGRFFSEILLGTKSGASHQLVLASDSAEGLKVAPETIEQLQRLVVEAQSLFGARHYGSYRFLLTLSDQVSVNGIEHHECSDNRLPERSFVDEKYRKQGLLVSLAHEFVHSWNGKYRRPDGLATTDFQQPMRTRLLWVYEGLTEYLGVVLSARSGLCTAEMSRECIAIDANWAKFRAARPWRPLGDTAVAAPYLYVGSIDWESRGRSIDFYGDGAL
jgi:predicted metalloprotease with PDZ domain